MRREVSRWASDADWNAYRDEITHLYIHEKKTLAVVMSTMEEEHGFLATYVTRSIPPLQRSIH
jgi:hypothetical protein